MKITLLEPLGIPAQVLEQYKARLEAKGHSFTAYGDKTTDPAELIRRTGDSDIAIIANNPYPAQVVEAAPNLKMLDVAFTGIDHVALDACKAKNVMICNAAGYSTQCVAELAIALTIACLRKMPACETATRTGGVGGPLRGGRFAAVPSASWAPVPLAPRQPSCSWHLGPKSSPIPGPFGPKWRLWAWNIRLWKT